MLCAFRLTHLFWIVFFCVVLIFDANFREIDWKADISSGTILSDSVQDGGPKSDTLLGFEMIGEQHVGVGGGEKEQESVWRAGGSLVLGRGPSFIYEAGKNFSWRDVTSFWGLVERQSRGLVYNVGEKDESGGL